MGSTICTAGFPSAAIASSCFTARCDSIWYGFFIATLLFSAKENSLSAYQGWERGSRYFLRTNGHPLPALFWGTSEACQSAILQAWPLALLSSSMASFLHTARNRVVCLKQFSKPLQLRFVLVI